MEATLEEVLLKKNPDLPINVLVANIPLSAADTVSEVRKFFKNTRVKTSDFHKGFNILHARAVIRDGFTAFLMGSSFKQGYFSDARHSIRDVRHHGSLLHDASLFIAGPAIAQIDKTFATFWKSTTDEPLVKFEPQIGPNPEGDNVASVQVYAPYRGHIHPKGRRRRFTAWGNRNPGSLSAGDSQCEALHLYRKSILYIA
jgi:phosphatidylserine/phosphatidylglycerophosphate/cardiolipin synthase-like enzyme